MGERVVRRIVPVLAQALALALVCGAAPPGVAEGAQSVALHVELKPERLGRETTVVFEFAVAGSGGGVPAPLSGFALSYPANLGLATSGLGVETCTLAPLEAVGPAGCPPDSRLGEGEALVEVPFGPGVLQESGSVTTLMGPLHEGLLGLLFYAAGTVPLAAELIFPGFIGPAVAPYGGTLQASVPPVPTLPGAPDAALVRLRSTIGPLGLTYYERAHGHTRAYRPRGIVLPPRCPAGGFPFALSMTFDDGSQAAARAAVPCPVRTRGQHGPRGRSRARALGGRPHTASRSRGRARGAAR